MAQEMNQHVFVNKPFYKWIRKCSECNKRSVWSPTAKCTGCKTYCHRRCKVRHIERTESMTPADDPVDAVPAHDPQPNSREDVRSKTTAGTDETSPPVTADEPCSLEDPITKDADPDTETVETEQPRQTVPSAVPRRPTKTRTLLARLFCASSPSVPTTVEELVAEDSVKVAEVRMMSSGDIGSRAVNETPTGANDEAAADVEGVHQRGADDGAVGTGPHSKENLTIPRVPAADESQDVRSVDETSPDPAGGRADERSVDKTASAVTEERAMDKAACAVSDDLCDNPFPMETPPESCCWLNAQFPKKFWPNNRHFIHSSNCLAFPFPEPIAVAISDSGDHHQETLSEVVAEQKTSVETTPQTSVVQSTVVEDQSLV